MAEARLRSVLGRLPAYVAGQAPAPAPAGVQPYKLSSNENPFPPLPGVVEAARAAASDLNRYPPPTARRLESALAERLSVSPEQVVVGAGSVGLLQQLVAAAAGDGDEVVHAWRSFEAYPIVIGVGGGTAVPVALAAGGRHDLAAMAAAVTDRTRMVLLCSPNNPTGPALGAAEVAGFLDAVPPDVLVVLDEAYVEFVRDPAAVVGLELMAARPNVALLRTFSKAYGLAGMRVGYAVAAVPVASALRQVTVPFTVSAVSEAAALAALAAEPALQEQVSLIVAERVRVLHALRGMGFEVPDAEGNFVWLPTGHRTAEFTGACEQRAVSVRPFGVEGVRITIGEPEANDRVLEVAGRLGALGSAPDSPDGLNPLPGRGVPVLYRGVPADQERWSAVFQRLGYGAAKPLAAGVEGTVFSIGDGLVAKVWRRRTVTEVSRLQAFYDDLAHSGLPFATPRILAIGTAEGSVYSLEPELDGQPLAPDDGASRPLPRAAVEAVLDVLSALAEVAPTPAMHRVPVLDEQSSPWAEDRGLSGHRGFGATLAALVERRVSRAPAPLRAALPDLDAVVSAVNALLGDLDDVPLALVHGDLIPANILVDDRLRPTAVLDFGFLTVVGDPAMDAAITAAVYDMYSPDAARIRTELDAAVAERFAYPAERIALYRAVYALTTATAFDVDGRDGHFDWCVQTLTRPDVRDLIG